MNHSTMLRRLCISAMIAALYTAVSLALAPFTFGSLQVRVAEALTLLPILYPEAIAGLTFGCFLTNLFGVLMGLNLGMDILFGTLATLLAALATLRLRSVLWHGQPWLAASMPVLFNGVVIGAELSFLTLPASQWLNGWLMYGLSVALGEALACYVLGLPLIAVLRQLDLTHRFHLQ